MKIVMTIAALMVVAAANAQSLSAATSARSVSGQFYVSAPDSNSFRPNVTIGTNASVIRLEPTLVAVSCERIKQAVWRELEFRGPWQHKVVIALRPARSADDRVTIVTERSADGWAYRVEMPEVLPSERYLRALVQVVLLELANRRAGNKPVEIPVWLTEGLAFHLLCNNGPELLLGTPRQRANGVTLQPTFVEFHRFSALEKAHKILLGTTPLTFEELSWPAPGQFEGTTGPKYQASAQLLCYELLKLRGGPECMRNFLSALPDYLNWQMAFLRGFEPHFSRPLDAEKWWTLEAMEFAGRDLTQTWPYEESWTKLADALMEPVDIFVSTNQLPNRSSVPLQTVIREWDTARQKEVLRRKATALGALRLRLAPELMSLSADYASALEAYLQSLETLGSRPTTMRIQAGGTRIATYKLLKRLEALDAQLEQLRPGGKPNRDKAPTSITPSDIAREMRLPTSRLRAN